MEKGNKGGKRVFHSMIEFEREFFPVSHKEKIDEEKSKNPDIYGTGLAIELLESIRQQLAK